jgi:hypothetical protein
VVTTSFESIRDGYRTVIRALQPRRFAGFRFDFVDDESLVAWATRMPASTVFRKCEFLTVGEVAPQSPIIDPSAQERRMGATLTIAYPVLENLVGPDKYRELEDVMRDDAAQLHDKLFWSGNYQTGQSACMVNIAAPTRINPQLYLQTLALQIDFYETTTLGA